MFTTPQSKHPKNRVGRGSGHVPGWRYGAGLGRCAQTLVSRTNGWSASSGTVSNTMCRDTVESWHHTSSCGDCQTMRQVAAEEPRATPVPRSALVWVALVSLRSNRLVLPPEVPRLARLGCPPPPRGLRMTSLRPLYWVGSCTSTRGGKASKLGRLTARLRASRPSKVAASSQAARSGRG